MANNRNRKFWVIWNKAQNHFKDAGLDKEEIEAERQEFIKLAGGKPDAEGRYSTTRLNNSQFNTLLDLIETTLLGEKNMKRRSKSLIWAIEQQGLDDAYLDKIAKDQHRIEGWRNLHVDDLAKLRFTAVNRANTLKKKAAK